MKYNAKFLSRCRPREIGRIVWRGGIRINVRMPERVKAEGDKVLSRKGVSVSRVVRAFYEYLDKEQNIPGLLFRTQNGKHDNPYFSHA